MKTDRSNDNMIVTLYYHDINDTNDNNNDISTTITTTTTTTNDNNDNNNDNMCNSRGKHWEDHFEGKNRNYDKHEENGRQIIRKCEILKQIICLDRNNLTDYDSRRAFVVQSIH